MGKDYYKTLGLERSATDDEIKKAYRRMALKFHPDKNKAAGAEERFKEAAEAYDVLSDPKKKEVFDKYGEDGLKAGGVPGAGMAGQGFGGNGGNYHYQFNDDPMKVFAQFFGGEDPFATFFTSSSGGHQMQGGMPGGGGTFMSFGPGGMHSVNGMHGGGGSGMGRHANGSAGKRQDACVTHDLPVSLEDIFKGTTKKMKITRKVLNPDGQTTIVEDKVLTIQIKPGWKAGTKVTFPREGDQAPNKIPADIVFVIKDKPHAHFKRESSDLRYTAHVPLRDVLCGTTIQVPTIEGASVPLRLTDITRPNTCRRLSGQGLPMPKAPSRRGDLIVEFDVQFPKLEPAQRELLLSALPIS